MTIIISAILLHGAPAFSSDATGVDPTGLIPPLFEVDSSNYTSSGSIKLSWHSQTAEPSAENVEFELQRATERSFSDAHSFYKGPDLATYISGLANGNYYYRIREVRTSGEVSPWSAAVEVVVEHHSLSLAFTLFGIGAVVFILTLIVVLRGAYGTAADKPNPATSGGQRV